MHTQIAEENNTKLEMHPNNYEGGFEVTVII
jgi:hypothetical protein